MSNVQTLARIEAAVAKKYPQTKAELNRAIAKHGFELVRGPEGYFYWAPLKGAKSSAAIMAPSVYVYRFDGMSPNQWWAHAKEVIEMVKKDLAA